MNKQTIFNILLAGIVLLAASGTGWGSSPARAANLNSTGITIPYTGYLSDAAGIAQEGNYDFTFTLYAIEAGGQALWVETQSSVPVVGGIFSAALGSLNALPSEALTAPEMWLSVAVRGPGESVFTSLEPRQYISPATASTSSTNAAVTAAACPHDHFGDKWAGASSGYGLRIENTSNDGISVYSAGGYGVAGTSGSSAKSGIRGYNNGAGYGVWGSSTSGIGVYGEASASGSSGVFGLNSSSGYGVQGSSVDSYGIYGYSTNSTGVFGESISAGVPAVHGRNDAAGGMGVSGFSSGGSGVSGGSTSGVGVSAYSYSGTAIEATGTGQIFSSADTVLYLSPHDMVLRMDDSSLASLAPQQDGSMRVRNNAPGTGTRYVSLPISTFGTLFGSQVYVKSLEVCYRVGVYNFSYIDATTVTKNNGSAGGFTYYIYDLTERLSNTYECYTVTSATPRCPLDNSSWVQLNLSYSCTDCDIYLYAVNLTLSEYDH